MPTGRTFVVVDTLGAGIDEMVLICQGSSARLTPETEKLPIDAVVIGLVDTVDVGGNVVFSAQAVSLTDQMNSLTTDNGQLTTDNSHANDRRYHPQRGARGPGPDGQRGCPGQRQSPWSPVGKPRRLLGGRRRRLGCGSDAFQAFRTRPLEDRRKAVECIRKICVSQAEELGRAELEETKIGRLDHKIGKLRDAIPQVPGVEYLRTDNVSGDDGMILTDYAPFGVIGAITPVTHSLPTLAGNAISMLASGNTVVFNAHPSGMRIAAEGVRRFNKAIREAIGLENLLTIIDPPTIESAAALFDHKAVRASGRHRRARRRAGRPRQQEAGDRRRAGQSAGRRRRDRLPRKRGQVDHQRRGLRQQPALHRRETGLWRRPDLRPTAGSHDPPRRLPASRLPRSMP